MDEIEQSRAKQSRAEEMLPEVSPPKIDYYRPGESGSCVRLSRQIPTEREQHHRCLTLLLGRVERKRSTQVENQIKKRNRLFRIPPESKQIQEDKLGRKEKKRDDESSLPKPHPIVQLPLYISSRRWDSATSPGVAYVLACLLR